MQRNIFILFIISIFILMIPVNANELADNKHYLNDEHYLIVDPITKWMIDHNTNVISKEDLNIIPTELKEILTKPSFNRNAAYTTQSYSTIYNDNNEYVLTIGIIYNKNNQEMYCLDSHLDAPNNNQYTISNDNTKQAMWLLINYGKTNNVSYGDLQFALWYYFKPTFYVNQLGPYNLSVNANATIRNALNASKVASSTININNFNKEAIYDKELKQNVIKNINISGFTGNYALSFNSPNIKVYLSNSNTLLDHNKIKSGTSIDLRINPYIDVNNFKLDIKVLDDTLLSGEIWTSIQGNYQNLSSIPNRIPLPISPFYINAKKASGSLKIIKHEHELDLNTSKEIAGVEYKLYYDKQLQYEVSNSLKATNELGEIIWDDLLPDTYYAKEYKTNHEHLIISDTIYSGDVISNETVLINNKPIINDVKGGFMLQKVYLEHDSSNLIPINDVTFAYKPLASLKEPTYVSSNEQGMVLVSSLDTGLYLVWEHQSNHENLIIDSTPKVIEVKPNLTTKLILENNQSHVNQQLGKLIIEKGIHQLDSDDIILEQGVSFQLKSIENRNNDTITSYFDILSTDQNGQVTYFNLKASSSKLKYYYQEISATNNQVIIDNNWYEVTIKDNETTYLTNENKVVNDVKGKFTLTKHRRLENNETKPLANVSYTLYKDKNLQEVIGVYQSDSNGILISQGLDLGLYYLQETNNNNEELYLDDKIFEVKIENNKITKVNDNQPIINEYIETEIEVSKLDQYHKYLANAKLVLYDKDNNIIKEWSSTNNSKKITLRYGEYYILEKDAPKGYTKTDKKYRINIKEHKQKVKITIINYQNQIITSGLRNNTIIILVSIMISLYILKRQTMKVRIKYA